MRPIFFPLFRPSLDEPLEQASISRENYLALNRRAVVFAARLTSKARGEDIAQEALTALFVPGDGTEPRRWDPREVDLHDHSMRVVTSMSSASNRARDFERDAMKRAAAEAAFRLTDGNRRALPGTDDAAVIPTLEDRTGERLDDRLRLSLLEARLEGDAEALDVLRAKLSGIDTPRELALALGLSASQVDNALKRITHHARAVRDEIEKMEKGV